MNLDAATILVIIGSVVASAGVIGKNRLERCDAAVNQMVFGEEALFKVIVRKVNGFLRKRGVSSIYQKLFTMVFVVLIVSFCVAALYTLFLGALYWATNGSMGISSSESPPVPEFAINAVLALIWICMALAGGFVLYVGSLLFINLVLWVIFLPYRIVHKIEAQATLERALTLTGLILGVAGVLLSRMGAQ